MSGWDDIANDQRINRVVRDANRQLRIAERAHSETIALATAALDELRRLAPDSPIHNSQVQKRIGALGSRALDRSNDFQTVWNLAFDLDKLFVEVLSEFEEAKAAAVKFISESVVTGHRHFFWPLATYGRIRVGPRKTKIKYKSLALAEAAKGRALAMARDAKLGDELNVFRLLAPIGK